MQVVDLTGFLHALNNFVSRLTQSISTARIAGLIFFQNIVQNLRKCYGFLKFNFSPKFNFNFLNLT